MILSDSATEGGPRRARLLGRLALVAILVLAAGLRLWRLDRNGWGNPYYSAAARSMLSGPSQFFFGSFDPVGLVTVDKPPVALWLQAASAGIFGFRGFSLFLPQALLGVGSVWLTGRLVRRTAGVAAGLIAAFTMAITPISVAIDRENMPDPALVFVLLLAAECLARAVETGRVRPLLAMAALVGLGFNIKMLAAFVVLPTFYLAYLLLGKARFGRKVAELSAATAVLVAVSLSWSIVVELTPKDRRPYIGGSQKNSALELALGYNGLGRVFGGSGNPGQRPGAGGPGPGRFARPGADGNAPPPAGNDEGGRASPFGGPPGADEDDGPPGGPGGGGPPFGAGGLPPFGAGGPGGGFPPFGPGGRGGPGGFGGGPPGFGGTPGLLRFTNAGIAGQITWLFPLAVLGLVSASGRAIRDRSPGEQFALVLWAGWLGTHWLVFSFARGIFHEYYTTVLGPAVAALVGIGTVALWRTWAESSGRKGLLPSAILMTLAWETAIIVPDPAIRRWMLPVLIGGAAVSAIGCLGIRRGSPRWANVAIGLGLATAFVGPGAWSLSSAISPGVGMMPSANASGLTGERPSGFFGGGPPPGIEPRDSSKLIGFLKANRRSEKFLVAATSSMEIAPIIIASGEPAVSLGGFMGADPVIPAEEFARMVEAGELRFFMLGGGPGGGGGPPGGGPGGGGPPGSGPGNAELLKWVRDHGVPVPNRLWQAREPAEAAPAEAGPGAFFRRIRGQARLYDLRPDLDRVEPTTPAPTATEDRP